MTTCLFTFLALTSAQAKLGPLPKLAHEEIEARLSQYNYNANYTTTKTAPQKVNKSVQKHSVEISYMDASTLLKRKVSLDVYQGVENKGKKSPVIFVLPPLRGLSRLDVGFAEHFASLGYIAVISYVTRDILDFQSLQELSNEFTHNVIDNRVAMDYLSTLPEVDATNFGMMGVSLGGIRAGLLYGIDPRIKATYIIVGGGNIPGIMVHSEQKHVLELKNRFMQKYKFRDFDEYELAIRKGMLWDPIWSAQKRPGRNLHMVIGGKDIKVHTEYQKELFSQLYEATSSFVNLSHEATAAMVFLNKNQVVDFFDARLL